MRQRQTIKLEIDLKLLKKMLKKRALAVCDIHCASDEDKRVLQHTLLQVVAETR